MLPTLLGIVPECDPLDSLRSAGDGWRHWRSDRQDGGVSVRPSHPIAVGAQVRFNQIELKLNR